MDEGERQHGGVAVPWDRGAYLRGGVLWRGAEPLLASQPGRGGEMWDHPQLAGLSVSPAAASTDWLIAGWMPVILTSSFTNEMK